MSEDKINDMWGKYAEIARRLINEKTDPNLEGAFKKIADNPYKVMKNTHGYYSQRSEEEIKEEIALLKENNENNENDALSTDIAELMVYLFYKDRSNQQNS